MLKRLLWKDFRQSRAFLAYVVVFLLIPYIFALCIGLKQRATGQRESYELVGLWAQVFMGAAGFSVFIWIAATGFIGAHVMGSEIIDRSREFLMAIPIPKRSALASKVFVGLGACLTFLAANAVVLVATEGPPDGPTPWTLVTVCCGMAALNFCVSWCAAVFIRTPGIAAASGVASVVLLATVLVLLDFVGSPDAVLLDSYPITEYYFAPSSFVLAALSFVIGCLGFLRRADR